MARTFGTPGGSLLARWASWCLAVYLFLTATGACASTDAYVELRGGSVTTTVDGVTATAPLALPYHWDRLHAGRPGLATFELPFTLAAEPQEPWGIFIRRAGNVLEVRLNGTLLQVHGDLSRANGPDYARVPIYVPVPGALLKAGENHLQIRIRADSGRRGGLSRITLGPGAEVRAALYQPAYAWRFTGAALLAAFSLVVGSIAMALWFTQADASGGGRPRRDGVYLWVALAEFCWAVRMADGVIAEPPLPWPYWGVLMSTVASAWIACAMMFCYHLANWNAQPRLRWLRWGAAAVVAGTFVASALALHLGRSEWLTAWLALEIGAVAVFVGAFAVALARRPEVEGLLVAAAALVTVGLGIRDWFVIRLGDLYGTTGWVRYSTVFLGLALLLIVLRRFQAASAEARGAMDNLARQVAQRERELATTFAALEAAARGQARTQEREHILREMHDRVGSRISSAIRQLETPQVGAEEVLRTLRDSLDQLKLSIDSIHMPPGDVGALLAALRYRMEPRLAAAGLALEWAVDELPPVAALDTQGMRQLQFLLFEAVSNVMQHAGAKTLRIEAAAHAPGQGVDVRVIDDGRGFDASAPPRSLSERAGAIGVRLRVESRPGRTVVQLGLG